MSPQRAGGCLIRIFSQLSDNCLRAETIGDETKCTLDRGGITLAFDTALRAACSHTTLTTCCHCTLILTACACAAVGLKQIESAICSRLRTVSCSTRSWTRPNTFLSIDLGPPIGWPLKLAKCGSRTSFHVRRALAPMYPKEFHCMYH